MRAAVVLLLMAGLCACMPKSATIHSARALYRPSDAAGGPRLKSGLWVETSSGCRFDESSSAGAWPACASWMVVRPGVLITHPSGFPADQLETNSYVLVSGYPRILQLGAPRPHRTWMYDYKGLRPLDVDGQGAITGARLWSVDCVTSLPPPSAPAPASASATGAPDPCATTTPGAARAAIIASEDPRGRTGVYHWLRDQEH